MLDMINIIATAAILGQAMYAIFVLWPVSFLHCPVRNKEMDEATEEERLLSKNIQINILVSHQEEANLMPINAHPFDQPLN